jgi:hypothetical protein
MPGVHLPADVELEDRLAFGLTGRQLAILAATVAGAYGTEALLGAIVPLPLALAGATLAALAGAALALARRDGLHGDELALALARFALAPRTLVLAPDGLPAPLTRGRLGVLEPPVARIYGSGLVERADGTHCRLLRATGTSFALRDPAEQAAFVAAFARFLNGVGSPLQIHVSHEPASLEPHARAIERGADGLPDLLAAAAADHARYLRGLGNAETPLLRRRILIVLACAHRSADEAAAALAHSADQACELLAGAGVALAPLTGDEAAAVLAALVAPPGAPPGSRLEGVVGARG